MTAAITKSHADEQTDLGVSYTVSSKPSFKDQEQ